jgi:hypothetical protein
MAGNLLCDHLFGDVALTLLTVASQAPKSHYSIHTAARHPNLCTGLLINTANPPDPSPPGKENYESLHKPSVQNNPSSRRRGRGEAFSTKERRCGQFLTLKIRAVDSALAVDNVSLNFDCSWSGTSKFSQGL